jgi:erythromycin esterase-like protein
VKDAEEYYRASAIGRADSWNIRDSHMVKAIHDLIGHRTKQTGAPAKVRTDPLFLLRLTSA